MSGSLSGHARREGGVSLIDVLMSMFLLSVALLGLAVVFPPAYLAVFQGRTSTHAVTMAEQQIELARRTAITDAGYGTLPSLAGTVTSGPYTMTTTVTADAPATDFTTVNVRVTGPVIVGPNTPDVGPQTAVVETFIARPAS